VSIGEVPVPEPRPPDGFFDPEDHARPYAIILQRLVEADGEAFRLVRPIAYADAEVGGIVVPADVTTFRTDLASVPRLFTWLVPPTGTHLPAALIHDGLVHDPGEPQSYRAGTIIDRTTADAVFRRAMRDLGTSRVRSWLVWAAVTVHAMCTSGSGWRRALDVARVGATVVVVVVLGALATADVLDWRSPLPWMGELPFGVEVARGFGMAVVITGALSLTWWPHWRAGWITGLALALLVHVTVAVGIVVAVFNSLDRLFQLQLLKAVLWALLAVVVTVSVLLLVRWAAEPDFLW